MRTKIAALLLAMTVAPAWAATCEVTVEGNDQMKFNTNQIVVDKSCEKFTVTIKHAGKMAKAVMGHNFVLAKTADLQGVAGDAAKAGAAKDYIPDGDARVIAHTKLVGAGESDSVTIDITKLDPAGDYSFFCSFPGHWAVMKGSFKIGA